MYITIPSIFVAHGAPLLAIEQNDYTQFLAGIRNKFPRPKAIILFSAHWEAPVQMVGHAKQYETIYDFFGFPKALYEMKYPASGDSNLAERIEKILQERGIQTQSNSERGLDHGAWVVLHHMYPKADVPVILMSVNPALSPEEQYQIGKALSVLREEDVLIIGSGGTVHNLRAVNFTAQADQIDAWALAFDQWLEKTISAWDLDSLFAYREKAPYADLAVPYLGTEHFVPIFYAMGAADSSRHAQLRFRSFAYGNLSYSVWQFN
ncbi:MAG: dioxygenase [Tuberibacillus sp.]